MFSYLAVISRSFPPGIMLNFSNNILIDIYDFNHNYSTVNLETLYSTIFTKDSTNINKLEMIINIFFKLYSQFKNSLK